MWFERTRRTHSRAAPQIVDLNYLEETSNSPVVPVAIHPSTGHVVSFVMHARMPIDQFEKVVALASDGCQRIHEVMCDVVRRRGAAILKKRGETQ